mmetsp:Transcript_4646/g.6390  ORF Transcript_4646/g.6390 Transcript_4646/m.6390 type:complete len:135 (-) Transcript_4646:223-627(-)
MEVYSYNTAVQNTNRKRDIFQQWEHPAHHTQHYLTGTSLPSKWLSISTQQHGNNLHASNKKIKISPPERAWAFNQQSLSENFLLEVEQKVQEDFFDDRKSFQEAAQLGVKQMPVDHMDEEFDEDYENFLQSKFS